ncbi:hypothetical protein LTSEMIN_4105, partial [Salmonella enterica subsp. enterica serovar Minnesota str. A4-603]
MPATEARTSIPPAVAQAGTSPALPRASAICIR